MKDYDSIPAMMFTADGKWRYNVTLDYTGQDFSNSLSPGRCAWKALERATSRGASGTIISRDPERRYTLVVPEPPTGVPVMAKDTRS